MRRFEGSDQLLEQAHKRAVFVGWQCRSYELPHVVDQGDQCSMLMLALLSESQEFGGLLDPIPLVQTDYDIVEHRSRVERRERVRELGASHGPTGQRREHLPCPPVYATTPQHQPARARRAPGDSPSLRGSEGWHGGRRGGGGRGLEQRKEVKN